MKTAVTVACILLGFAICSIAGNSIANNAEVNEYKVKAKTIKGIVQPFELGGETTLIRSAVKY